MTLLEAMQQVLSEAGEPLHYREIAARVLRGGLWQSAGQTPAATVSTQLSTHTGRPGSRFQRTGPGMYALASGSDARPPRTTISAIHLGTVSFTKAAERVLELSADHRPMHYREITAKALELGLVSTTGQTPEATMYAQVITEIQRATKRGVVPRFTRHGRGYFGLSRWLGRGLAFQIEQHNKDVAKKLHERIRKMNPLEFEGLIRRVLVALGFDAVAITPASGDGGIDVRGTLVVGEVIATRMAVQVKRWKHNVQSPVVQQVRGSLGAHEQGLIITTSDFSAGARGQAARPDATPVALMNGEQLVALLIENEIGVQRTTHHLVEMGEDEA